MGAVQRMEALTFHEPTMKVQGQDNVFGAPRLEESGRGAGDVASTEEGKQEPAVGKNND